MLGAFKKINLKYMLHFAIEDLERSQINQKEMRNKASLLRYPTRPATSDAFLNESSLGLTGRGEHDYQQQEIKYS